VVQHLNNSGPAVQILPASKPTTYTVRCSVKATIQGVKIVEETSSLALSRVWTEKCFK